MIRRDLHGVIGIVSKNHNVSVVFVEAGDEYCSANGESNYIDSSYMSGGDRIVLGIYDNEELKLISFFHEIGHKMVSSKFNHGYELNTLLREIECWRLGIIEASRFGVLFSDEAISWGYNQALSYSGHDRRESSDYEDKVGDRLWVNLEHTERAKVDEKGSSSS